VSRLAIFATIKVSRLAFLATIKVSRLAAFATEKVAQLSIFATEKGGRLTNRNNYRKNSIIIDNYQFVHFTNHFWKLEKCYDYQNADAR
jgi:hypothetical protein